jgi:hypothetical protein
MKFHFPVVVDPKVAQIEQSTNFEAHVSHLTGGNILSAS